MTLRIERGDRNTGGEPRVSRLNTPGGAVDGPRWFKAMDRNGDGDVSAGEVMVPRTHVTAFDAETSVDELLRRVAESKHSRYPIYRERIDNVVGVLHVKDLINYASFAVAWLRGKMDGQDPTRDIFNKKKA